MRVTKITVGRLFNLGSYEHVRYELSVDVGENDSAAKTLIGVERILEQLNPRSPVKSESEIARDWKNLERMRALSDEEHARTHGAPNSHHYVGTRQEYEQRIEDGIRESEARRAAWAEKKAKARQLLDDLGGAVEWKDAKLDWEDGDY